MTFLERLTRFMCEVKETIRATCDLAKELHTSSGSPVGPQYHPWNAPPNPSVEDIAVSQKDIDEYQEILRMCEEPMPAMPATTSPEAPPSDT